MLEGCTRTSKKSCRRGAAAGIESPTLGNLRVCADSHMASCGHMLATKNTIKITPASGARSHFCSNCKTVQMQVTIFHQRSAEHVFCSSFLQIAVSFSCISFCDFAVESCSSGMHSGGTTGRRKEKTGRGGWAGIRVWVIVIGSQ